MTNEEAKALTPGQYIWIFGHKSGPTGEVKCESFRHLRIHRLIEGEFIPDAEVVGEGDRRVPVITTQSGTYFPSEIHATAEAAHRERARRMSETEAGVTVLLARIKEAREEYIRLGEWPPV